MIKTGAQNARIPYRRTLSSSLLVLIFVLLAMATPVSAPITIEPGVTFSLDTWANISFSNTFVLQDSIQVTSTELRIDGVGLGISKSPAAYPSASVSVSTWLPTQSLVDSTAFVFVVTAPSGSSVWFNFTNVLPYREYLMRVDGFLRDQKFTNSTGAISFQWTAWSTHTFMFVLGQLMGSGGLSVQRPRVGFVYIKEGLAFQFYEQVFFKFDLIDTVVAWHWDFGDGETSNVSDPYHVYRTWGVYHVSLTVTASNNFVVTYREAVSADVYEILGPGAAAVVLFGVIVGAVVSRRRRVG